MNDYKDFIKSLDEKFSITNYRNLTAKELKKIEDESNSILAVYQKKIDLLEQLVVYLTEREIKATGEEKVRIGLELIDLQTNIEAKKGFVIRLKLRLRQKN